MNPSPEHPVDAVEYECDACGNVWTAEYVEEGFLVCPSCDEPQGFAR